MEAILTYRKRQITHQDIHTINRIIEMNPDKSRRFISQEVCREWDWKQPNGFLKDMVCRSLLLLLESKGLIKLPPQKVKPLNPLANRKNPESIHIDSRRIQCTLNDLLPIKLEQVRRTKFEKLFNGLINDYHYLKYTQPVGEHLKYIAFSKSRPIACLAWGSSPWYIGARDRYIGWTRQVRENNLHLIANNIRFLILTWCHVPCLETYLLAMNRRSLSQDWENLYHHTIYLIETFVDPQYYHGTCYRADNWRLVGHTTGVGKLSKTSQPTLSKKAVYVYPMIKKFRKMLCYET